MHYAYVAHRSDHSPSKQCLGPGYRQPYQDRPSIALRGAPTRPGWSLEQSCTRPKASREPIARPAGRSRERPIARPHEAAPLRFGLKKKNRQRPSKAMLGARAMAEDARARAKQTPLSKPPSPTPGPVGRCEKVGWASHSSNPASRIRRRSTHNRGHQTSGT
jgi:hypothetical protein